MSKVYNTEQFVEKAKLIHEDKYDYSKVEYKKSHTKVCIICPEYGEFWQTPNTHLGGGGCKQCGYNKSKEKKTKQINEFIAKANQIHDSQYDYSFSIYRGCKSPIQIVCHEKFSNGEEHGMFEVTPDSHLNKGVGCPYCSQRKRYTTQDFIKLCERKVNSQFIDYSITDYKNRHTKIKYTCHKLDKNGNEHGIIEQLPNNHIKYGCPKCGMEAYAMKRAKDKETFIDEAIKVHGNYYDYSKVNYINEVTPIEIICQIHGSFYQKTVKHLHAHQGCPKCKRSSMEVDVSNWLMKHHIKFLSQHKFEWLKNIFALRLDFYLPDLNIAIECQGVQHFISVEYFGGKKA